MGSILYRLMLALQILEIILEIKLILVRVDRVVTLLIDLLIFIIVIHTYLI